MSAFLDVQQNPLWYLCLAWFSLFLVVSSRPVRTLPHELTGQCRKLLLKKNVFRRWIQGDMNDGVPYMHIECRVRLERLHTVLYRDVPILVRGDLGMSENLCGSVVRLDFMVGNHSVEEAAGTDIRNHRITPFS